MTPASRARTSRPNKPPSPPASFSTLRWKNGTLALMLGWSSARSQNKEVFSMLEAAHPSSGPGCTGAPPPVLLTGFIGPSGKDGLVRIYRDLTFRSYSDVPAD